jgi:hypothetical protein
MDMILLRLLMGTAALTVAATVAQAADMPVKARPVLPLMDQASGYVEVYGGWGTNKFSVDGITGGAGAIDNLDGSVLGGAGRGNYWINPNMSVQLDAQAEGISYRLPAGFGPATAFNTSSLSYLIGGHFNWRDSQRGLLGVFAAAGDQGSSFGDARRHAIFGGEAQMYWNQLTLYVQGGYDTTTGTHLIEPEAWFVRGTGRYFFTPNTMLEATVLYANGDISSGIAQGAPGTIDFTTWSWEAKLEHRFAATPFSLYAKYRGSETEFEANFAGPVLGPNQFKVTEHRFLAGLRLYMGQDTLLANDRQGATLDIKDVTALPLFGGIGQVP